jgi:uncharacterized protein (DUF1697 family)
MHRYVALLRGINVGGNNIIKMVDLKACFEKMGFSDVSTFIQSGNVIFRSPETNLTKLTEKVEKTLSKQFSYQSTVVVVSDLELKAAVKKAPKGFGEEPKKYRYDVIFLKAPLSGKEAIKEIKVREGVDEVAAGKNVLYFWRTEENITKSYVSKIILLPIYKQMTIRNWNTTSKLFNLIVAAQK